MKIHIFALRYDTFTLHIHIPIFAVYRKFVTTDLDKRPNLSLVCYSSVAEHPNTNRKVEGSNSIPINPLEPRRCEYILIQGGRVPGEVFLLGLFFPDLNRLTTLKSRG